MADFRKAKYSGSLNLAPECGPVLIELDTVAKTATASLEDPASQYTMEGGGGGLDYVIPEQTVIFPSSGTAVVLSNIGELNELNNGEQVIVKILPDGAPAHEAIYAPGSYWDGNIEATSPNPSTTIIEKSGSDWKISFDMDAPVFPLTATVSAIHGF